MSSKRFKKCGLELTFSNTDLPTSFTIVSILYFLSHSEALVSSLGVHKTALRTQES